MKNNKLNYINRFCKDMKKYWKAYLLVLPVIIYFILFHFKPLYGIIIAFKDYRPTRGIWESPWTDNFGLKYFLEFFKSYYFLRLLRNTLRISLSCLVFGWPAPIILALLLNELKSEKFKKITQTVSYLPHFISTVIICGMVNLFVSKNGFITQFLNLFGYPEQSLLSDPNMFVPIYVISNIWAACGWGTIIYLAALSGIDGELYDAAKIDGANRWKQTLHVTLPGISGTIIIMFLLRMGSIMSIGHEKIMLLYNPGIYETADVISTYVYRSGIENFQYSYSTAVGIFNNVINFIIVTIFNKISKKVTEVGLW
ncbi:MAG: sugar ABC transporter permease [Lachnospiraceae bacterium]|nr:sugar ABC transporter permease [Lachnospiraceae bacterium]